MELKGITMPGYKIYEYLLVLSPHEELWNKIIKVKEEFAKEYKSDNARWGRPHVALLNFVQYNMMEERIVNRLNTIAMGYPPFKVELKDFDSYPTHNIHINVISKVPIQNLVKEIRSQAQKLMKFDDEHKPYFIIEPHITIGRKLQPLQYEKAWLEYSHKHFTGRFIADTMLLLKRPAGEMKYQIAERFQFQNLPLLIKQGKLFG